MALFVLKVFFRSQINSNSSGLTKYLFFLVIKFLAAIEEDYFNLRRFATTYEYSYIERETQIADKGRRLSSVADTLLRHTTVM
jgi:hypothetical protein